MDAILEPPGSLIVRLVELGFLGFAVIPLIISGSIVRSLITGSADQNPQTLRIKMIPSIVLMVLSAVVFFGGLSWAFFDRKPVTIYVEKSPVRSHFEQISLSMSESDVPPFADTTRIFVRNKEKITIDLDKLDIDIAKLKYDIEQYKEQIAGRDQQLQTLTEEIFNNDPNVPKNEQGI